MDASLEDHIRKLKINEKLKINLRPACLGKPRKINTFRKDFIWRD